MAEAGEMVRAVVIAVAPVGVRLDGVKEQNAPEGSPPVQAKVTVEWKGQSKELKMN